MISPGGGVPRAAVAADAEVNNGEFWPLGVNLSTKAQPDMLPYLFFVLFINAKVAALDHSAGQHSFALAKSTGLGGTIGQPSFFSV